MYGSSRGVGRDWKIGEVGGAHAAARMRHCEHGERGRAVLYEHVLAWVWLLRLHRRVHLSLQA